MSRFVAGTLVWELARDLDAEVASERLEASADWRKLAERKPIEQIVVGDHVLSLPEDDPNATLTFERVDQTFIREAPGLTLLTITASGDDWEVLGITDYHALFAAYAGGDGVPLADLRTCELTGNAAYLTDDNGHTYTARYGWTYASDLEHADELIAPDQQLYTHTTTAWTQTTTVYNLDVNPTSTYFVGNLALWVHNSNAGVRGVPEGTRNRGPRLGQQQGRQNRVDWLEVNEFDPRQPRHIRGWLRNERRRVAFGNGESTVPRTPRGYEQAHFSSTPARHGYDYANSQLQLRSLNQLEEAVRRRLRMP